MPNLKVCRCCPKAAMILAALQVPSVVFALDAQQVYERASQSVVVVETFEPDPKESGLRYRNTPSIQGSGVIVDHTQVVTNCHVARMGNKIGVRYRGQHYEARFRYADRERDLCQLSVKGLELPAIKIGRSAALHPGATVYAIGAPQGLELTISNGIISGIRSAADHRYLQTTAAISPGSSGGGLFNEQAELIGITTFQIRDGQTLNFAIPIEWLGDLAGRAEAQRRKYEAAGGVELEKQAMVAQFNGDWDNLLKVAKKLVEVDPYWCQYWLYAGSASAHRHDNEGAKRAFARAIELGPDADNWRDIADGYLTMGFQFSPNGVRTNKEMLNGAKYAIDQAIGLEPDDASIRTLSGEINYRLGNPDRAVQDLNEAVRLRPNESGPWMTLMEIYQDHGNWGKAAYSARKAMAANPDSWQIRVVVLAVAADAGDESLRREAYAGLKRLNPEMASRYDQNRHR